MLFKLVNRIDTSDRDDYQKRAIAFLSERFTSYWMYCQKETKTICEQPLIEMANWKPDNSGDQRGFYNGVFKGDVTVERYLNHIKGRLI